MTRRPRLFTALAWGVALLLLDVGLRVVPPALWEAGLYKEDRLDVRFVRDLSAKRPPSTGADEGAWGLLGPQDYRYNRHGYRDVDWGPPSGPRAAFLGDSRIFGLFVEPREVLSEQYARKTGVEALNFGVPGASSWAGVDHIVGHALEQGPTAAVLLFDINSSLRVLVPAERYSRRGEGVGNVLRSSALLRRAELLVRHAAMGWDGRVPAVPLIEYELHLGMMIDRLRRGGVSEVTLLVGWTPMADVPGLFTQERYDAYREATRRAAAAAGARVVEVEAVAARLPDGVERVRGLGIHFSPELLDALADELAR